MGPKRVVVWILAATLVLGGCTDPSGRVVAEAGGEKIYERQLEQEAAGARARGVPLDTPGTDQLAQFYNRMVRLLIDATLLRQEAERSGVVVPKEEIEREVGAERSKYTSEDDFNLYLDSYRLTLDELRGRVRQARLIEGLWKGIEKQTKVTEEEARAYYEKHRSRFRTPTRATARVLFASGDEQAAEFLRKLRAGEGFEGLAKHAITPDAVLDGAKMEIEEGTLDPVLEAAVFAAPIGQIVGPVKVGELRRYVFRVERRTPSVPLSFVRVHQDVLALVRKEKADRALRELVLRLRKERGFRVLHVYPTLTQEPSPQPTP